LYKDVAMSSPVNVAIYARVSSDQQAKEQTIVSQVAALKERVARDGCTLAAVPRAGELF
jgi:site-specific DNA recombinase